MKLLRKLPSESVEGLFFEICLKSKSGCNVKVDGKYYNVNIDNNGEYVTTEFRLDYELTEEEFNKFKK